MKTTLKNQLCFLLAVTLAMSAFAFALRLHLEQRRLAGDLIRLHVVANSDEGADQETKLRVRDAVLPVIASLTQSSADAASARAALATGIPAIRDAAERGASGEEVAVTLTEESFPRRAYDTFTLPAGRYTSLRITLGAGEGHNWWCVAFPSLCLPATAEGFEDAARTAGLDSGQILLITSDDEPVRIKFRVLDWLEALFG